MAVHAGTAQVPAGAVEMGVLIGLYWWIPCSDFGRLGTVGKVHIGDFQLIFQQGDTCSIGGDMRETVFAAKAPPSLHNIVGMAGRINEP